MEINLISQFIEGQLNKTLGSFKKN